MITCRQSFASFERYDFATSSRVSLTLRAPSSVLIRIGQIAEEHDDDQLLLELEAEDEDERDQRDAPASRRARSRTARGRSAASGRGPAAGRRRSRSRARSRGPITNSSSDCAERRPELAVADHRPERAASSARSRRTDVRCVCRPISSQIAAPAARLSTVTSGPRRRRRPKPARGAVRRASSRRAASG